MMQTPTVFLYNLDTPKGSQIKRMCLPMKIRVRSVKPEEYAEPLAALSGQMEPTGHMPENAVFTDEMLLLVHFTNSLLDAFLQGFRRHKIVPVELKAIYTPHNAAWNSIQLREELLKEREAMTQGGQAHGPEAP